VTDERKALQDVLAKLNDELHRLNANNTSTTDYVYLSGTTTPNIGDINVYGVLRAIQHLPIYQEMILSKQRAKDDGDDGDGMTVGSPIVQWVNQMSKHMTNVNDSQVTIR
jgi:hypothetical protein